MVGMISAEIRRFVGESLDNRFPDSGEPYFDEPLVGFAAADDPLFAEYKRIIGDFHRAPGEILDGAATVICWVLPVTRATRESNRKESLWPSRQWALTRNNGEGFNSALRRHLAAWLQERGHRAVAPQLAEGWRQLDAPAVGVASTWSERHAAYAAGLGTFSLNDALITPRGIAHRLGSVITDLPLPPTPRTSPDHRHNCLWYREGSCGACIGRCPAGALSRQGHDKARCRDYVYGAVPAAVGERYGVAQTGCGLCQTRVPCETQVPAGRGRATP
ncbi:epoxyqueuosine reductase [Geobacter pickeringii]|uniref:FeS-binding protein n=1 Tax=Geobacter pickeringii TaxID=345632 RepID=A0A0B5B7Y3_9BACT|nr:epoxyqueuosine reductase [Geobacter pickeringii]AJE02683.1 FeS-binding protein [Geobacter pickeringii]